MQIGEVAKRTSLTVDAILFYEKRKLLPKVVRSAGRLRLHGEGTIERLAVCDVCGHRRIPETENPPNCQIVLLRSVVQPCIPQTHTKDFTFSTRQYCPARTSQR